MLVIVGVVIVLCLVGMFQFNRISLVSQPPAHPIPAEAEDDINKENSETKRVLRNPMAPRLKSVKNTENLDS